MESDKPDKSFMAEALADLAPNKESAYKNYMAMDYSSLLSMYNYAIEHVPSSHD